MYYTVSILLLTNLVWILIAPNEVASLEVCVGSLGCLQGTNMKGYQIDEFEAFMGIPYAEPPIGDLRLKNPVPAKAWQGSLQARQFKSDCIQKNYFHSAKPVFGEEDCLYLNIFRPAKTTSKNRLPVLFYIHGGGYFTAVPSPSASGPEYFMDTQEVILVTFSYRLGPFGFISTGDENVSGNFGLKDQNLALKWVHDHISDFGGNPELVTIFGHSVGGCSVHFHMMSPASKGLFQRAVMMSGTAVSPYAEVLIDSSLLTRKLAEVAGIANANELSTSDLASALRKIDAHTLINAGDYFRIFHSMPLTSFHPNIEQPNWPEAFLTDHPDILLAHGNHTQVPTLIGVVPSKGESGPYTQQIWSNTELRAAFNKNFVQHLTTMLDFPKHFTPDRIQNVAQELIDEYLQGKQELNSETLTGFMEMFGDYAFYYPLYKTLNYSLEYMDLQENPLYVFKFNYRGPVSLSNLLTGTSEDFGCTHIDDVFFLFRLPYFEPYPKDSIDAKLVKHLTGIYVDFAKNGKLKIFDNIDVCNAASFKGAGENGICNYVELTKTEQGFADVVKNDFNVKRMNLWERVLKP